ncbi:MAG TPA: glycine zipper family protein [Planctomycetota bacterium]|nr:glycine zipper family protein [Planctomycetota bacterium]
MGALKWVVGPLIRGLSNGGLLFGMGFLSGNWIVALVLGLVGLGLGLVHGFAMAFGDCYDYSDGISWFKFILDNTWSVTNSLAGSIYQTVNLIIFNPITQTGAGTGTVVHHRGVIPGYATTVGNVIASDDPGVQPHERLHVLQARIFGPLYLPLVIASYIIGTVLPYWLIYHNYQRWPITSFGTYFMNGVYPHAWNEEWAYRTYP